MAKTKAKTIRSKLPETGTDPVAESPNAHWQTALAGDAATSVNLLLKLSRQLGAIMAVTEEAETRGLKNMDRWEVRSEAAEVNADARLHKAEVRADARMREYMAATILAALIKSNDSPEFSALRVADAVALTDALRAELADKDPLRLKYGEPQSLPITGATIPFEGTTAPDAGGLP